MPPLVPFVIAWLGGLIVAHHWLVPLGVPPVPVALLSIVPLVAIPLWWHDRSVRLGSLCALALLAGALRYQSAVPDLDDPGLVAHYNDRGWITVEGIVADYPDQRDTWTNLTLAVESLEQEPGQEAEPARGRILVRAPRYPQVRYGDRLRVSGLLETPPVFEDFSYEEYLQRKGISSVIWHPQIEELGSGQGSPWRGALFAAKGRARQALGHLLPDPEAALLQGIVLGTKSSISRELYEKYNATGTSHIIVISGVNITLVSGLFSLIFGRLLGKRRAYWLTLGGIAAYVALVGADAAVVRAGLMGGLYVTALYLGRRSTAYVSLLATALALTIINPLSLWDAGFQLSFAATLSLILFAPALERLLERGLAHFLAPEYAGRTVRSLRDGLVMTLAAQILTVPLVAYHFGRLSLVSPLANALIALVQPPVMVLGSLAAALALLPPLEPLAQVVAWIPWLCLAYTDAVVQWLAGWPLVSIPVDSMGPGWLLLCGAGLSLGAAGLWLSDARRRQRLLARVRAPAGWPGYAALSLAGAGAVLAWLAVAQLPDGRLHVAFLDVGQGDAILITTPMGQQVLVDGGPSPAALTSALGKEMAFWDRSLDLVIMTHADADHLTGLVEVLNRYAVGAWLDNGLASEDVLYTECQALQEGTAGAVRHVLAAGHELDLGQGVTLEVLHPPPGGMPAGDANANSVVLRLVWGQASFLLTGDIEAEAEAQLLRSGQPLAALVLKVAHHGSGDSSGAEFLAAVAPRYAVISVGAENRFGHPAPAVLSRLAASGETTVFRTDQEGTVEFVTDGERVWVQTGR
jgi:competence protein ComEC